MILQFCLCIIFFKNQKDLFSCYWNINLKIPILPFYSKSENAEHNSLYYLEKRVNQIFKHVQDYPVPYFHIFWVEMLKFN